MRRKLSWWFSNGAFAAALYAAIAHDIAWVQYACIAFVWIMLAAYIGVLISPEIVEAQRKKGPAVPRWLGYFVDVAFLGAFLSAGWYLTGIVYLASCVCFELIYRKKDSSVKPIDLPSEALKKQQDEILASIKQPDRAAGNQAYQNIIAYLSLPLTAVRVRLIRGAALRFFLLNLVIIGVRTQYVVAVLFLLLGIGIDLQYLWGIAAAALLWWVLGLLQYVLNLDVAARLLTLDNLIAEGRIKLD